MRHARILAMLALAAPLAGCGAASYRTEYPRPRGTCLRGPTPRVGRAHADSSYAVLRDRWDALPTMSPLAQAALLPTLPAWIPDVSDMAPEPSCDVDLEEALSRDVLATRPIPLSRVLFARIVASRSRELLARLASLPDAAFLPYQLAPGEPPPIATDGASLRRAIAPFLRTVPQLAGDEAVRARETRRRMLLASDDPATLFELDDDAAALVSGSFRLGDPRAADNPGLVVLSREIALARAWLAQSAGDDGTRFELALRWVRRAGRYAPNYGLGGALEPVLATLIQSRGGVPLARGREGADHDLFTIAVRARNDLAHSTRNMGSGLEVPRRSEVVRSVPTLAEALFGRDGARSAVLTPESRAEVLARVDRELADERYPSNRCQLMRERLGFTAPDERAATLARWLPEVPPNGPLEFGVEQVCAVNLTQQLEPLDAATLDRLRALAALPAERAVPTQPPRPGGGFWVTHEIAPGDLAHAATASLFHHAASIASAPEDRGWLADLALRDAAGELGFALDPNGLRAALAVLPHDVASNPSRAQELLRRWVASSRRAIAGALQSHLYAYERFAQVQYALAEFAPLCGLEQEVGAYFAEARRAAPGWGTRLADGEREYDGIFAVCEALLQADLRPPT